MFFDAIKDALMITSFVLVMMMIIEYITVQTKGNWSRHLKKSGWAQIIIAAILGVIPGCLGTFTAVSLYTHEFISFAALITAMIASSGDEAFVMLSVIPGYAIKLFIIIFIVAVISGFVVNIFFKNKTLIKLRENHFEMHEEEDCFCYNPKVIISQLKNTSFQRALLITITLFFIIFLIFGKTEYSAWDWKKITFLIITLTGLFIVTTVPEHFLNKHLWEHIIKKHMLKIFLWTSGALLFIHFFIGYLHIGQWIEANQLIVLFIAVLIGIIPESGPHIVFITLFANGTIPFSILLANSIVQDGHGALPLLAESRKSFIAAKLVNVAIALIVGLTGLYLF